MAKSLSHQVGILTLGRIFAFAVMFFVPIVNVRMLSLEAYGYYRQFWLVFETLSPLLILGFPRSLLYYFPRVDRPEDKSIYVTQTIAFLFVMSLVAFGVYVMMGKTLGGGLGLAVRSFFWRISFFTMCMMVSNYMDSLFVAEKQATRQAVYHFVSSALQAIIIIVVSWTTRSVNSLVWALAVIAAAKCGFALVYTYLVYRPSLRLISPRTIREQLSFALPLGLAAIALIMLAQTDKFIITRYLGREAFAIYSVAAQQVPFVNIIRGSVTHVTLPLMAGYQKQQAFDQILELWQRAMLKVAVLFYPAFIFLEITARPFINMMFTEAYADAVPVFAIYLLLLMRSSVEVGQILQVFKENIFMLKVFVVGFFVNLGLSLLLFKLVGRLGVPISTVIAMFMVNVVNLAKVGRLLHTPFLKLLPWFDLAKRFVVAAIPGVVLWVVSRRYPIEGVSGMALAGVAYSLLYLVLTSRLGYITMADIRSLLGKNPI